MNELLDQLNFSFPENFSLITYVVNIVIATILLYILSYVYEKQGNSISNRKQLSRVLVLVGITTFIIISIVKSSLALSLGLVGALSIVRFRTAIKEPEELGFFFVAICIGLGMGADQLAPTLIGFAIIIIIVKFMNKVSVKNGFSQNVLITLNVNEKDSNVLSKKITEILEENTSQLELKRMSLDKNDLSFNFLANVSNFEVLQKLNEQLVQIDQEINISFIDNQA